VWASALITFTCHTIELLKETLFKNYMGIFLSTKQSFLSIEELHEVVQNFEMCYFNLKSRNIVSLMLNCVCCILLSNLFGDIRQGRTKT
jgi:hypothetical protein